FQAEDGIRDLIVTGVQTCALPIFPRTGPVSAIERRAVRPARAIDLQTPTCDQRSIKTIIVRQQGATGCPGQARGTSKMIFVVVNFLSPDAASTRICRTSTMPERMSIPDAIVPKCVFSSKEPVHAPGSDLTR